MKCNCCKKNEANVFYSETVNGKKAEAYLCNECAEKLGVKVRVPELSGFFGKSFFYLIFFSCEIHVCFLSLGAVITAKLKDRVRRKAVPIVSTSSPCSLRG